MKLYKFFRMGRSKVLHKESVAYSCHYFLRGKLGVDTEYTNIRKRGDHVCDECQRLARLWKVKKVKS